MYSNEKTNYNSQMLRFGDNTLYNFHEKGKEIFGRRSPFRVLSDTNESNFPTGTDDVLSGETLVRLGLGSK